MGGFLDRTADREDQAERVDEDHDEREDHRDAGKDGARQCLTSRTAGEDQSDDAADETSGSEHERVQFTNGMNATTIEAMPMISAASPGLLPRFGGVGPTAVYPYGSCSCG
jgi:hypothetical protein